MMSTIIYLRWKQSLPAEEKKLLTQFCILWLQCDWYLITLRPIYPESVEHMNVDNLNLKRWLEINSLIFEGYRRNHVPQLLAPWGPNVFGHTIVVTTHQPKWWCFAINIWYRSLIHFCFQWVWLILKKCSHVSAYSEFKIYSDSFSEQPVEELAPLDQTLEKEHEEKTKVKNIQVNLSLHETFLEVLDDNGCLHCTQYV